jgi:hypothetical protein
MIRRRVIMWNLMIVFTGVFYSVSNFFMVAHTLNAAPGVIYMIGINIVTFWAMLNPIQSGECMTRAE